MNIQYIEPLSKAWSKMTTALFKPFDISKWFALGFTAFLAGLMDWHGGKGSSDSNGTFHSFRDVLDFPANARDWLLNNQIWFTLIVIGVILLFAFIVLLVWLSSRGKFMFLDNVIFNRAQVIKPWHQYKALGNSLFGWRIVFGLICFALFILFFIQVFIIAANIYEQNISTASTVILIIGMALLFLLLIVVISFIDLFLNDFIVPIMYKNNFTTNQAWNHFLPVFTGHWLYFIAYGFLILLLHILVVIAVIFLGLFTCCIGILLLIIPYIGSVITLPISYTFRAFSVLFLEQFGNDFSFFPEADELPDPDASAEMA